MEVILLIVGVGVIIAIVIAISNSNKKAGLENALRTLDSFSAGMILSSPQKAIGLDQVRGTLGFAYVNAGKPQAVSFSREVITGAEVETSGGVATTKKTGFAKFSTDSHLLSIVLRITLNSAAVPVIRMPLYSFNKDTPASLSTLLEGQAMELANTWQSVLISIVRASGASRSEAVGAIGDARLENETPHGADITSDSERPSALLVADEILKLSKLRDNGILSDEEFSDQKQSLLTARKG